MEFKQTWPNLKSGSEKAEFIRDVLAIANSARPDQPGYIIYGVADARHGGVVVGVEASPSAEQIAQILSAYTAPVPDARFQDVAIDERRVSVIGIYWNPYHPYSATREVPEVLRNDVVYIRRGPTVGTMSVPEFEIAIRRKDSRVETPIIDDPLRIGFVEEGSLSGPRGTVVRVVNISGEPVENVSVIVDVAFSTDPSVRCRQRLFINARIDPGKPIEGEIKLHELNFYRGEQLLRSWRDKAYYRGFDITLHVQYRDRFGYLRRLVQELATCD